MSSDARLAAAASIVYLATADSCFCICRCSPTVMAQAAFLWKLAETLCEGGCSRLQRYCMVTWLGFRRCWLISRMYLVTRCCSCVNCKHVGVQVYCRIQRKCTCMHTDWLPCCCLCPCMQPVPARFPHNMLKGRMGVGKRSPGESELQNDYQSKLLHLAWHPEANVIACAAANSLYMYCA